MTLEELHDYVESKHTDVVFTYHGQVIVLYTDEVNGNVTTDDFGTECHDSWEELIQSDYFWGKKLGDIVEDLVPFD